MLWEQEKLLVRSASPFLTAFSTGLLCRCVKKKNTSLFAKELAKRKIGILAHIQTISILRIKWWMVFFSYFLIGCEEKKNAIYQHYFSFPIIFSNGFSFRIFNPFPHNDTF